MTAFRRIGGPYAITAWTLLLPAALWPVIAWTDPTLGGSLAQWIALGAIAGIAAGAVLAAARLTVLPCRERPARPWVALAVFAAAGVAHGAVSSAAVGALGIEYALTPERILLRAALAALWMSVIALAVSESRRHRAVVDDLRERIATLREVEQLERERLDDLERQVRADAVAPVLASLERIRGSLAPAGDGAGERTAALRLGDVIAKQVRPLSHALLDVAPGWSPPPIAEEPPPWHQRLRRIIAVASGRPSHHPWVAALIYEASATPLLAVSDLPTSLIVANAVLGTAILGAGATLGNRVFADRLRGAPAARRLVVVIAVNVATVAVGLAVFTLLALELAGEALWYPAPLATFPLLVLIVNVVAGVADDRRAEERRLAAISQQVEWATARIAQRVRHERQVLGAWLHGPTQSALLAVASRIEHADEADRATAITAALPDLAAAIESLQELVDGVVQPSPRGADAIRDLARMWEGVLDVQLELPASTRAAFEADPGASSTVVDVLAEALANAVRHGGAGTALVRIDVLDQPDRLRLEVADDGELLDGAEPGMGSRLLDAVTLRWSLTTRTDGWTVLAAEIPYGAAPSDVRLVGARVTPRSRR
jgi:signal transduction histidine kinase